ncbi:putative serine threonine-kinase [Clavispora lusitaniae]|uniref:Protein kinase domain-containing protein n=3 Tax=Clavispora lusitaniae TaxID=36911 RepID=C4XVW6_CLAL4|nr:uncharacterized protein CLUG_00089 [Clavispora lusitaniae ATCC 42720]QFZ25017.1 putative serine threonine-kinase [Clavispora lusitaniae]EEQ35966.1 hypothetical protein CLUG_00089 [Clavispora lusitaniae ATCC 42720]QFZ31680.1 putative serine threonine-kinase [Clavispora lusitaniae]QFZ37348.1 putative serine threonine-kinase [Clavispora lusitaniae]QFZ43032.1 putative serine threonine-kinase [Clavispora lusitaniae]
MNVSSGTRTPFLSSRSLPEDDNTFAPPALSAYGIALLSDKTDLASRSSLSGVYGEDIKENTALKNSLKSRLSVHFKDNGAAKDSGNASSTNSHSSSIYNSGSHNSSSHNISLSTSNHTLSGTSFNSSSNFNGDDNDEFEDQSGDTIGKLDLMTATTPGGSDASSTRPSSTGLTNTKRSRLARRFKSLGPPKRASEMPPSSGDQDGNSGSSSGKQSPVTPSNDKDPAFTQSSQIQTPIRSSIMSPAENGVDRKRTITGDSKFFKSLEIMKQKSPGLEPLADVKAKSPVAAERGPTKRSRSQNSSVFPGVSNSSSVSAFDPLLSQDKPRIPLQTISSNIMNIETGLSTFRKPKAPKLSFPHNTSINADSASKYSHTPAVSSVEPLMSTRLSTEDQKTKKVIVINSRRYEKLELIGRGGTSKVYKVRCMETNNQLAIKKVAFDSFDESCVNGFKGEIELLTKLKNESRVVELIDHVVSDGSIYLVMECGEIDLAHVFSNRLAAGSSIDLGFVRFHAIEVLRCVEAVHRAGIVHSDLKPANFLFVKGILKIIDFGIANAVPDHTANIYRESQIGTPNYMAPEALVETNHLNLAPGSEKKSTKWRVGRPSDIWSCGCIIYQMIYGRPPYGSYSGQQRIMAIMNPQVKIQYPTKGIGEIPVPLSAIELMQKCLARNPNDRWTVEECLNSNFLKPRAVSENFVKDLVYSAVNFGFNARHTGEITDEVYDRLVETVLKQIEDLNYA